MSGAVVIILRTDTASPAVEAVRAGISPKSLAPVIGRSGVNVIRDHLFAKNAAEPNQLGGKRTNYYSQAARATSHAPIPGGVAISINQIGIAQRYRGGVIHAKPGGWLTVPARAETHGKRAREFNDLRFVLFRKNSNPLAALVQTEQTRLGGKMRGSVTPSTGKGEIGGAVFYWLKKFVTQRADPGVLPTLDVLYGRIISDLNTFVTTRRASAA